MAEQYECEAVANVVVASSLMSSKRISCARRESASRCHLFANRDWMAKSGT